eukprot:TRINITY_DN3382_c0_g1_i1.p1 TRINITY_DN3382_c0_g1~~TRINITY_DN3382_c0_g1_i1.p1  ORF type:complete len:230 (+),score=33.18 TRINITY_DN3382_c0_g1_i1:129-818(+)
MTAVTLPACAVMARAERNDTFSSGDAINGNGYGLQKARQVNPNDIARAMSPSRPISPNNAENMSDGRSPYSPSALELAVESPLAGNPENDDLSSTTGGKSRTRRMRTAMVLEDGPLVRSRTAMLAGGVLLGNENQGDTEKASELYRMRTAMLISDQSPSGRKILFGLSPLPLTESAGGLQNQRTAMISGSRSLSEPEIEAKDESVLHKIQQSMRNLVQSARHSKPLAWN